MAVFYTPLGTPSGRRDLVDSLMRIGGWRPEFIMNNDVCTTSLTIRRDFGGPLLCQDLISLSL